MQADDLDVLLTEFRDFKSAPDDNLPPLQVVDGQPLDLDAFWREMLNIKMPGDTSKLRFGKLSRFACVLLTLPHANADPERLFSLVGKIETDERSRLLPSTLRNLVSAKVNGIDGPCHSLKFLPTTLHSAKKATTKSLEKDT